MGKKKTKKDKKRQKKDKRDNKKSKKTKKGQKKRDKKKGDPESIEGFLMRMLVSKIDQILDSCPIFPHF